MDAPPIQNVRLESGETVRFMRIGSGRPLLYVGSGTLLGRSLEAEWGRAGQFLDMLAERFDVVLYAMASTGDDWTDRSTRELSGLVKTLNLGSVPVLSSQTSSSPVAVSLAARFPETVSALALMSPALDGADNPMARIGERLIDVLDVDELADILAVRSLGFNERGRERARQLRKIGADRIRRGLEASGQVDVTELARDVHVPTMIWYALDGPDIYYDLAAGAAAAIPGSRVLGLPGVDSLIGTDEPRARADATAKFFTEIGSGEHDIEADIPLSGFQTILFTDLESSTALTQRVGDEAAQEVLRGHNTAVRAALEANGGREVKHTGDGIMASFPSAVAAVQAGIAIQHELMDGEVRVRVGINAGEPIAEDDDLFGTAVQLAARIVDRAEPGQVLVSNVVRELCAGKTFEFTSMGEATLKGFDEPVTLYQVRAG